MPRSSRSGCVAVSPRVELPAALVPSDSVLMRGCVSTTSWFSDSVSCICFLAASCSLLHAAVLLCRVIVLCKPGIAVVAL